MPNYTRFPVALVRGEGSLRVGRPGAAVSRFLSRLGLQSAGPLSAAGGRGDSAAGGRADSRAQHVAHRGAGPLGADAFGAKLRRQGVLLQLGRGSERGGDQAGPAARAGRAATRSSRSTAAFTAARTARPAPRPSRSITKASARCWPAFCTHRTAILDAVAQADRRRDVRDPDRADPGRRRHPHSAGRISCRVCANWPTSTSCC